MEFAQSLDGSGTGTDIGTGTDSEGDRTRIFQVAESFVAAVIECGWLPLTVPRSLIQIVEAYFCRFGMWTGVNGLAGVSHGYRYRYQYDGVICYRYRYHSVCCRRLMFRCFGRMVW